MSLFMAPIRSQGPPSMLSDGLYWYALGDEQADGAVGPTSAEHGLRLRHASTRCLNLPAWYDHLHVDSPPSKSPEGSDLSGGWPLHPSEQGSPSCPIFASSPILGCTSQVTVPPQDVRHSNSSNGHQVDQHLENEAAHSLPLKHALISRRHKRRANCEPARKNVLITDPHPRRITKKDGKGRVQGVYTTFGTDQKFRASYSASDREATAFNRKWGACLSCRSLKWRCPLRIDPYTPCERCSGLTTFNPCIIVDILDINLFRLGSTRNDTFRTWMATQKARTPQQRIRRVSLTQDLGFQLDVMVSYFEPGRDDVLWYDWKDPGGRPHKLHMPPYYINNMQEAGISMQKYFKLSRLTYIESLMNCRDEIIRKNFEIAKRYVMLDESNLVSDALDIWAATRITERTWRICGDGDTLDCNPVYEDWNPWNDTIPVTPIMDTQLDDLVLRLILLPAQKRALRELNEKIRRNRKEDWLEVYLFIFITMSNFDYIFMDLFEYSHRHALDGTPRSRPNLRSSYVHACKALLAHFHFTYRGASPLHLDWTKRSSRAIIGQMSREQSTYLRGLGTNSTAIQLNPEPFPPSPTCNSPNYWSSQVLMKEWTANLPYMGPVLELTEQDLLTS